MNIKLLEAFLAVIDYKTMSSAAAKLFTSQPNISMMIRDLENMYGTRLFNRVSKNLYLTCDGEKLEQYARRVVSAYREMNQAMYNQNRTVRIGSSVTIGHYLLHRYLEMLKTGMTNFDFEIVIHNTQEIEKMILNNRIDIAIVEGKIHSKNIAEVEILEDELIAVVAYDYPLSRPIEQMSDLEDLPWISREDGSHYRNQFEIDMNDRKIHPKVVFQATNLQTIIQAVENHYGFAIISKIAAEEGLKKQSLRQLDFADYRCFRSIRCIYYKNRFDNAVTSKILECVDHKI